MIDVPGLAIHIFDIGVLLLGETTYISTSCSSHVLNSPTWAMGWPFSWSALLLSGTTHVREKETVVWQILIVLLKLQWKQLSPDRIINLIPNFLGGSAIFGISLKLYTLMMDTPVYQYLILKKRPFLPLSELQKVSPRHSKSRKQRNTLPLFFNFTLSSCAFRATSLGDWLLLVERNIANPK